MRKVIPNKACNDGRNWATAIADGLYTLWAVLRWFITTNEWNLMPVAMMRKRIHLRWIESRNTKTDENRNNVNITTCHHQSGCLPSMGGMLVGRRDAHAQSSTALPWQQRPISCSPIAIALCSLACFQLLAFYYLLLFIESFSRASAMTLALRNAFGFCWIEYFRSCLSLFLHKQFPLISDGE